MSFLEKCLFRRFANILIGMFVFLVWSHLSTLYMLDINSLSEISLANIFSHTVGSFVILLMFSLAVPMLFNLMRAQLFILSFMSRILRDISGIILLQGTSEIFLPMFSSRTFMVLQFILKSFILLSFFETSSSVLRLETAGD